MRQKEVVKEVEARLAFFEKRFNDLKNREEAEELDYEFRSFARSKEFKKNSTTEQKDKMATLLLDLSELL